MMNRSEKNRVGESSTTTTSGSNSNNSAKDSNSLVSSIDISELKCIKVAIKRDLPAEASTSQGMRPLRRKLRNPKSLRVHLKDCGSTNKEQPLFQRAGIVVNKEEELPSAAVINHRLKRSAEAEAKKRHVKGAVEAKEATDSTDSDGYVSRSPSPRKISPEKQKTLTEKGGPIFKTYHQGKPDYELPPERSTSNKYNKRRSSSSSSSSSCDDPIRRRGVRRASPMRNNRPSRRRSYSRSPPLRPGEYRPPKQKHRIATQPMRRRSRKRSSTPEYKRKTSRDRRRSNSSRRDRRRSLSRPRLRPGEYRPPPHASTSRRRASPLVEPGGAGVEHWAFGGPHPGMRYPHGSAHLRPIYIPQIHYIPAPLAFRPPLFPPQQQHHLRPYRPPIIYNNRSLPRVPPPTTTANTTNPTATNSAASGGGGAATSE